MNVFTNGQLAHVWAQQSQDNGRNQNGSFFFTGSTIYSYGSHFPIAKFIDNNTVLFTTESYGITTAKHCNDTRQAINHYDVFNVPCVEITLGTKHDYTKRKNKENHKENVQSYKDRINDLVLKASRARSNANYYNNEAVDLTFELNRYIGFFKLRIKPYCLPNAEQLAEQAKREKAAKVKREKAAKAKLIKDNLEKIAQWDQGDNVRLPYSIPCRLRIKGDEIQTSQNAVFPLKHGYLALLIIERCKANKTEFKTNGKTINLGHFKVDHIDTNGNVKAGCHKVSYEAIKRIAADVKQLVKGE